jgi:hypothetical protein
MNQQEHYDKQLLQQGRFYNIGSHQGNKISDRQVKRKFTEIRAYVTDIYG